MSWNKPGNDDNNQNPWSNKNNPPELDKVIAQLINKLKASLSFKQKIPPNWTGATPPKDKGMLVGIVLFAIFVTWFISGVYIVNPAEQAVVLQFGKYYTTNGPGMHWLPRFINSKYTVDVQKINSFSLEGDFLTKSSEQGDLPNKYVTPTGDADAASVSADKSKNLVKVEMTLQYRVDDPQAYLFNVVDPDNTVQEVLSGALSEVVGKMKLDEVLTTGRELLSSDVLERTKEVLAPYNTGLKVMAVTLRKVQAPEQVQEAFNDVNRADQDKATYIQQAQAYASRVVPLAQGVAARILADAKAYQEQVVLNAQAQIAKYQALLTVYKSSPQLMRQRMYLETMQSVFENTTKILVEGNNNNILNLPLDKVLTPLDNASALNTVSSTVTDNNTYQGASS